MALRAGRLARAWRMVISPQKEWAAVAAETPRAWALVAGYVTPLCALAAGAFGLGAVSFGARRSLGLVGVVARLSPLDAAVETLVRFGAGIGAVLGAALIVNVLAPVYGARRDLGRALQLSAYAATPAFVAGIFLIHPALAPLAGLGALALAHFYLGLSPLMGAPAHKRLGYALSVAVIGLIAAAIAAIALITLRAAPSGAGLLHRS
jgi:Yip1 domain